MCRGITVSVGIPPSMGILGGHPQAKCKTLLKRLNTISHVTIKNQCLYICYVFAILYSSLINKS